ncbi:hypothetical protein ES702_07297 [subsurface metagenome]
MYKTYIVGAIMILFGVSGILVDLIEGRSPNFEVYTGYILLGAGMLGLRQAIKKK